MAFGDKRAVNRSLASDTDLQAREPIRVTKKATTNLHRSETQPAFYVAAAAVDLDKHQHNKADEEQGGCHQAPVSLHATASITHSSTSFTLKPGQNQAPGHNCNEIHKCTTSVNIELLCEKVTANTAAMQHWHTSKAEMI